MDTNLDTLIVVLYVQIDDLFTLLGFGKGPGGPQRLTDSELVCLAVAQVMLGYSSERCWLRFAYCRLGHLNCPRLIGNSIPWEWEELHVYIEEPQPAPISGRAA